MTQCAGGRFAAQSSANVPSRVRECPPGQPMKSTTVVKHYLQYLHASGKHHPCHNDLQAELNKVAQTVVPNMPLSGNHRPGVQTFVLAKFMRLVVPSPQLSSNSPSAIYCRMPPETKNQPTMARQIGYILHRVPAVLQEVVQSITPATSQKTRTCSFRRR